MMRTLSRRDLLRTSAALGGLAILSSCAPAAAPSPSATTAVAPAPATSAPTASAKPIAAKAAWVALTSNQMIWPLALEAGYFKKYGVDLDLSFISGSNNAMAAMLGGQIDMTSVAGSAVVSAVAGGGDAIMIAGFVNRMIFRIMALPPITKIEQLKGQSVAVTRVGTADYFAWQTIIARQGWKPNDINFLAATDAPGQVAALASGKAAAIAVSPPNDILGAKVGAKLILDMASYNEPEQNVGVAMTKKALLANRALASATMRASIEAIARWKKDPAFVKDVIKKYLKNDDPEFLEVGYSAYKDVFEQAPYPSDAGMQRVIEEVAAQDAKVKDLKVATLIDRSVIEDLEKSGFVKQVFAP